MLRRCVILFVLMWTVSAQAETRAAFVVGNSAYQHASALRNPVADANLIAETLSDLEFAVSVHLDQSRADLGRNLSTFVKTHKGADVMLFYFAGHGMQFDSKNYLIPVDAALASEFDIEGETIALDRVLALLQRNSKASLVFVDACRDNPLANAFYAENFSETRAMMSRGLAPIENASDGAMVVFSASPGQLAFDGQGDNSIFAASLARHLGTENAEVLSLMKRVIRDVKSGTGDKQIPMVTNDLITEIHLKRGEGATAAAIAYREEERLFEAAEAINTPRAWKVYFQRFPNGSFHQQALAASETAGAIEMVSASGSRSALRDVEDATKSGERIEIDQSVLKAAEGSLDRETVRLAQAALNRLGYAAGAEDGVLGRGTRKALADFQLAVNLPSTGALTRGTASALGIKVATVEADTAQILSSTNARRYDPLQLALIEDDKKLLKAVEALRQYELIYGYHNNKLYIAVLAWCCLSHSEMERQAKAAGGYLATLTSSAEHRFVAALAANDDRYWKQNGKGDWVSGPTFGMRQLPNSREPDGGWVWMTGEPMVYRNWHESMPNNNFGQAAIGALGFHTNARRTNIPQNRKRAQWDDYQSATRSFIVEIE